ncbi:MAG TPA: exosortase/archaeosortase family protein [Chthoniobacterales bacterium]|nr:exosortase/archaeosortase family protein [Chthoniobacterales bacterium]
MASSVLTAAEPVEQVAPPTRSWMPVIWLVSALALLWFICFRHLSSEWSYNEQYSYGWFVPFFALYLFWLRWEDRPRPRPAAETPSSKRQAPTENSQHSTLNSQLRIIAILIAIVALLLLFPIRLIEVANPDWRPISWIHTISAVGLTLLLLWRIGGAPWLRHFAFPVIFALVSVPWISAIEVPIVQGLMPMLARIATEVLSLFGIPAEVQGNLVRINGGVVGVNEACSGVRSLQTSLMIGLLFGELKRLTVFKRIVLLAGAIAIAFVANCGRAFFLVYIAATQGLAHVEKWHDIAGYTIVGLVFFGCLGITAWLARGKLESRKDKVENEKADAAAASSPKNNFYFLKTSYFVPAVLGWLIAVEIAVEVWYRSHEKNLVRTAQWSVQWPEQNPGFRDLPIDERTRAQLHFDKGRGVSWRRPNEKSGETFSTLASAQPISLLFFFRWEPGHNSALLANAHRPDVCLPATGWRQTEDHGVRNYRVSPDLTIPFRHFVFAHEGGGRRQYAHAFYCVWEDRVRGSLQGSATETAGDPSAWTRSERLQAVRQGRRHLGQQVLEYLQMEPREITAAEAEENFARLVPRLVQPAAPAG